MMGLSRILWIFEMQIDLTLLDTLIKKWPQCIFTRMYAKFISTLFLFNFQIPGRYTLYLKVKANKQKEKNVNN